MGMKRFCLKRHYIVSVLDFLFGSLSGYGSGSRHLGPNSEVQLGLAGGTPGGRPQEGVSGGAVHL